MSPGSRMLYPSFTSLPVSRHFTFSLRDASAVSTCHSIFWPRSYALSIASGGDAGSIPNPAAIRARSHRPNELARNTVIPDSRVYTSGRWSATLHLAVLVEGFEHPRQPQLGVVDDPQHVDQLLVV